MKVILTGGAGFIGSWVADALIADGHRVLILDDLSSGKEENIPKEAEFVKCDIRDRDALDRLFSNFKPDIVNHHAAQINVRKSVENPTFDAQVNILGSLNLLEISKRYNVKKFIFASTGGAIYGEPKTIPVDERAIPLPISPYGVSKLSVERYLDYYNLVFGLEYVALRYSNVYGPRQNPHGEAGVIAIFCNRILEGQKCDIFGDGNQKRDYVFVGDLARANVLILRAPVGIYNLGTGIEISVNDLINILVKATGITANVHYLPYRAGEVHRIALDISKAGKVIGWFPEVSFEDGLTRTWNWYTKRKML